MSGTAIGTSPSADMGGVTERDICHGMTRRAGGVTSRPG
jgi:hypothetical protein